MTSIHVFYSIKQRFNINILAIRGLRILLCFSILKDYISSRISFHIILPFWACSGSRKGVGLQRFEESAVLLMAAAELFKHPGWKH